MSSLDAVLAQYEKNHSGDGLSQEEKMKKYFACILPQNSSTGQKKSTNSPYQRWFVPIQRSLLP